MELVISTFGTPHVLITIVSWLSWLLQFCSFLKLGLLHILHCFHNFSRGSSNKPKFKATKTNLQQGPQRVYRYLYLLAFRNHIKFRFCLRRQSKWNIHLIPFPSVNDLPQYTWHMSELAERNCLQQVVFKLSSLKFFTRHHTTSLCLGHEHRCFGHFWTKHLIQGKFQVSFFLIWLLGVAESKTQLSSPSS